MAIIIHRSRDSPCKDSGGENTARKPNDMGIKLNNIQDLRLPNLKVVLSLRYPAIGSEIASHILDMLNIRPITAGAMRRTSVENFITYRLIKRYMYPAPTPGSPYAMEVPKEVLL